MKMKSLLVAGLAVLALNAVAEDKAGIGTIKFDIEAIKAIEVGATSSFINAECTMDPNMGAWKNVEFTVDFPEDRLVHAAVAASNDTKVYDPVLEEDVQPLGWSADMLTGLGFPYSAKYIGVNISATPIDKANLNLCRVKLTKNADLKQGDALGIRDFKVIDEGDNTWINADQTIDLEVPGGGHDAVENINAGKAVAGVKYYNVAGQAADKAFDGVNVVVTTYADGTQNVSKVVK